MARYRDTKERRESTVREQTKSHILRLVEDYYPPLLRVRILRCVQRQWFGHTTNLCRHDYCPPCSPRESHNRAKRQLATFQRFTPPGRKVRIAHEVYTIPPNLQERVRTKDGFKAWKAAVFATIQELHGGAVCGIANLHPMGDRDITKPHLHWDVLVNGYTLNEHNEVVEAPTPTITLDDARTIYIRHIARELEVDAGRIPVIDAYWDRRKGSRDLVTFWTGKARVWNKITYSARNIYRPDRAWRVSEEHAHAGLTWAYKPKKSEPARIFRPDDAMRHLLAQKAWMRTIKPRVWFGIMADNQRSRTAQHFGAREIASSPEPEEASE